MIISYANGWAKTIDINGRTNRKEFWAFVLIDLFFLFNSYFALEYVLSNQVHSQLQNYLAYFCILIFLILGWFPRLTILIKLLIKMEMHIL